MFSLTFICEVTGVSYSVWKVLLTLRCLVALLCWQTATKDRMDKNCRDKKRVPCCVSGKQTAMTCEATVYILIKKRGVANSHRNYLWGFGRVLWEEQAPATRGIRERLAYSVRNNRITYRYRLYTSLCLLGSSNNFRFLPRQPCEEQVVSTGLWMTIIFVSDRLAHALRHLWKIEPATN